MAFDVCGPLPAGTTVLEASAGTGKTFTIAALATRYVAEGLAELPELMIVTFGRAATQELRERVRERFVTAERGLREPAAARAAAGDDLLRHLAGADDAEVARRRHRLAAALAQFDGATITTTHGFCQQVLTGLGILGDTEPGVTFVESIADLVEEVAEDRYLATFARAGADVPRVSWATARTVARDAVGTPDAVLAPAAADPASEAGQRVAFAAAIRAEVARRKRHRRLMDYDDLIGLLRDALRARPAACERVRERYRVVLVDEFQDTDDLQWEVLQLAFDGHRTLVLVGDPKQAIYAFRGGDVQTYLRASAVATAHEQLDRNWRSDPPLLAALEAVYGGAALGDPRIVAHPVRAGQPAVRLTGAPPLRLRHVRRAARSTRPPAVGLLREQVAADLAADVVRLLDGPVRLAGLAVHPADVAVLVRTNAQGIRVRDALAAAGVPVVLAGSSSVFATPSARAWLVLLQAVESPRATLARAAALTPLLGWTAAELDARGDGGLDELGTLLRSWALVLAERGVAALFEVVSVASDLVPRLLAELGGERLLTDLRHVAQELHRAGTAGGLGLTALLEWLQRRRAETGIDGVADRSRRLESDAAAVGVRTVHTSKGLEWPVVYVPFGWDPPQPPTLELLRLHDDDGHRVLDVGGRDGPGYAARLARHRVEEAGEDLRLLYVALTRAQSQVVAWWAPARNTPGSALHRLLFGGRDTAGSPPLSVPVPGDGAAAAQLARFASPVLSVEDAAPGPAHWLRPGAPAGLLSAAVFDRTLDLGWSRTSYTALTAAAHDRPGVLSEPEEPELADEPALAVPPDESPGDPLAGTAAGAAGGAAGAASVTGGAAPEVPGRLSPMAGLPAGAAFGTLVHEVFELVDTAADDLRAELGTRCVEAVGGRLDWVDPDLLAAALLTVMETPIALSDDPLGTPREAPPAGRHVGFRLRDVAPGDRLAELAFELPLAGGDRAGHTVPETVATTAGGAVATTAGGAVATTAGGAAAPNSPVIVGTTAREGAAVTAGAPGRGGVAGATLVQLADLMRAHLPPGDPLAGYPELLAALPPQALRGYLTGSIDALIRLPGGSAGSDRSTHLVVDYKTNRLGDDLVDYAPGRLADAMLAAHYPLQALLYCVAAHRFLRWRLPGYDIDTDLGGVRYLFVRGMAGQPTGSGIFAWRPPSALIVALSELLR